MRPASWKCPESRRQRNIRGNAYGLTEGGTAVTPSPASAARPRSIVLTLTATELGRQEQQQQGTTPAMGKGLSATARRTYLGATQEVKNVLLQCRVWGDDAAAQETFC